MSRLPKLKIKLVWRRPYEEICDFQQAKDLLNFNSNYLVTVDNQLINSYEELVQLATQDCYKDREFLEVVLVSLFQGG